MIHSLFGDHFSGMEEGHACLVLIACYYDKRKHGKVEDFTGMIASHIKKPSLEALSYAGEKIGFRSRPLMLTADQLLREVTLPCILQMGKDRFLVLFRQPRWKRASKIKCIDPVRGMVTYSKDEFISQWTEGNISDGEEKAGSVLLLEPTFRFYALYQNSGNKLSWRMILKYFRNNHWQIGGVIFIFIITSLIQLIFPFLIQSIVDVGINSRNLSYIIVVLTAQTVLVASRLCVDFIRSRLLLQLSSTLNLSILSDFWVKLSRLPLAYFDQNQSGSIMQRINDNRQIRNFMTGPALDTFFSTFNFIIFAIVLVFYKAQLFAIFMIGLVLYCFWMQAFFGVRRKINYRIFQAASRENNATLQYVQGMQEIRLQNIERLRRWEWEGVQADIFHQNHKMLKYGQLQRSGAILINQGKDLMITIIVSNFVIQGQLTFGAMFAIQYIIGQLTGQIETFTGFIQSAQDAKSSLDRLNEVHAMEDEEKTSVSYVRHLPRIKTIKFTNLSFGYPGNKNGNILTNIDLEIPEGKTTAIVGPSGSGKTTLLKLLLKVYEGYEGKIEVGNMDFKQLSASFWRDQCGAVLQSGYIFNDSISNNISMEHGEADHKRLIEACQVADILSFIESLPDGFDTMLGHEGIGVSQGQKQRLLIARAIYKDPKYLLFDESTNALDSNTEATIIENLQEFFKGRTVIIVAHRLSTVRNADKIVVMHRGRIVEQGEHSGLTRLRGKYFQLVKDQLDLAE